jgi:hypothetical protein
MARTHSIAALIGLCLALVGCARPEIPYSSGVRELSYRLLKVDTFIDPKTGDKVRVFHWQYEDNVVTKTEDRISSGGDSERRRGTPSPPPPTRRVGPD